MSINPVVLKGIEFIEFCSNELDQNHIHFILNQRTTGHSANFKQLRGPSISSNALRVENTLHAFEVDISKGA